MTRDPAWLMLAFRRRPGWAQRSRLRRLTAVLVALTLSLSWGPVWPANAIFRVLDIYPSGDGWALSFERFPDWERDEVIWSLHKETILALDQLMWQARQ